MKFPARKSIATRLIVQLVTVVTVVLSILGAITFSVQRAGLRAQFEREARIRADSLVPALVLPVWNLDAARSGPSSAFPAPSPRPGTGTGGPRPPPARSGPAIWS